MKLEFENNIIPDSIYQELDFNGFLSLLETDLAMIPHLVLRPMNKGETEKHFSRLTNLKGQIVKHKGNLEIMIQLGQQLPPIDYLLPFFKDQQLEIYHLFDLGRFVRESLNLESHEICLPLQEDLDVCKNIEQILSNFLDKDFGSLKLSPQETEQQETINQLSQEINTELTKLEEEILKQTGIKMVYPFPREMGKSSESKSKMRNCSLLNLVDKDNSYRVEFNLQEPVTSLMKNKELHHQNWKKLISKKLESLNDILSDLYDPFLKYYNQRKIRIFDYILLNAAKKHGLCLPRFTVNSSVHLIQGVLPALRKGEGEHYKPLDLSLNKGVNVLFGANMTGKTTVLKTLYFQLTLVKFGLPVPAKSIELSFPDQVKLHLRSSGQLESGLSGFGDEIRFFCDMEDTPAVYLIDELFHSTDPVNGMILTDAFLSGLGNTNSIIFCTSHYPEVLELPDITFYKMKDIEEDSKQKDLNEILKEVPYELELLESTELHKSIKLSDKPLRLALRFPLPEKILNNLRKKLED